MSKEYEVNRNMEGNMISDEVVWNIGKNVKNIIRNHLIKYNLTGERKVLISFK